MESKAIEVLKTEIERFEEKLKENAIYQELKRRQQALAILLGLEGIPVEAPGSLGASSVVVNEEIRVETPENATPIASVSETPTPPAPPKPRRRGRPRGSTNKPKPQPEAEKPSTPSRRGRKSNKDKRNTYLTYGFESRQYLDRIRLTFEIEKKPLSTGSITNTWIKLGLAKKEDKIKIIRAISPIMKKNSRKKGFFKEHPDSKPRKKLFEIRESDPSLLQPYYTNIAKAFVEILPDGFTRMSVKAINGKSRTKFRPVVPEGTKLADGRALENESWVLVMVDGKRNVDFNNIYPFPSKDPLPEAFTGIGKGKVVDTLQNPSRTADKGRGTMISTYWINGQLHETQLYYWVSADQYLPAGSEVFFYANSDGNESKVQFATLAEGDALFVEGEAKPVEIFREEEILQPAN